MYRFGVSMINWNTANTDARHRGDTPATIVEERLNDSVSELEDTYGEITIHSFQVSYGEAGIHGSLTYLYSYDEDDPDA